MWLRPTRLAAALALLLLAGERSLDASGLLDPLLRFRQTRTEHFIIYFHTGEEALASRLAAIVEEVRARVAESLTLTPPTLTHVVLADQAEAANGWATPLPRDIVFLHAAVPSGVELIGNTDDWLRLVFTHEYTHIVHLDRSGSWARIVRGIFGRTPVAFPNLWLPQWQIEGLATWEESALSEAGRATAGDFRAIDLVGSAAGRPLSLDRASGGLVRWPGGYAAYASGLGFHEYLAQRFGQQTLGALATRTSRQLPFLGTRAFDAIYGEPLGALWRDYTAALRATAQTSPVEPSNARRLTTHGYVTAAPRFAGRSCDACPASAVYSTQGPHDFPSLRSITLDGSDDRVLTTRYLGSTIGISSSAFVFDQQELRREAGLYSDLYRYDRRTGDVRPISHEARLQDPDLAPDGRVVAVREHAGQRDLVILEWRPEAHDRNPGLRVLAAGRDLQFSTPRWSRDGRFVVAERRRLGTWPDLVVVDVATGAIAHTMSIDRTRLVTPAWRPDGRAVVAAANVDGRPFEIFEFPLDGEAVARPLTRSAGAIWPDVSEDGETLLFAGYTAGGYDVFTAAYAPVSDRALPFLRDEGRDDRSQTRDAASSTIVSRDYSPLRTLVPTSWIPLLSTSADQTRIGGAVTGADVLGRHAYEVGATWRVESIASVRPSPEAVPDWNAAYAYSRWRPSLFASASRDTLYRESADEGAGGRSMVTTVQHEYQAGLLLPITHVRTRAQAFASLVRTDTRYLLSDRDRRVPLVSSRVAAGYSNARIYGYSISPEEGLTVGATIELARRALGSRASATTSTADARLYLPGAGRHHVIAIRAAGGLSRGDNAARQTFVAGRTAASSGVVDFGANALGLVRDGLPETAGTGMIVGNVEYRLPLAYPERGVGTWPLLLRTLHASVFADAAQVRGPSRSDSWRRAIGAELAAVAVAGYTLPFNAAFGISWGADGGRSGASAYARLGRAF